MRVKEVGLDGMKIDRMYFDHFEDKVKDDKEVLQMVEKRDFEGIENYILQNIFDKPEEYFNLNKLRNAVKVDRRLSLREIIEKIFGFIPYFKSKDELLKKSLKNLTVDIYLMKSISFTQKTISRVTFQTLNSEL